MNDLVALLRDHGYAIVLAAVLVEQIGLPLPAFPLLIVAGALAVDGSLSAPAVLGIAMGAALAGDSVWFHLGRRYGDGLLLGLNRLSPSRGLCVSQPRAVFARLGLKTLLVARFVPGLAALAPSIAGLSGYSRRHFVLFDAMGAGIWAGSALLLGAVFHRELDTLANALGRLGAVLAATVGAVAVIAAIAALAWRSRVRLTTLKSRAAVLARSRCGGCGCGP